MRCFNAFLKSGPIFWSLGLACLCGTNARAAEIKVIGGSAVTPVMAELIPRFETLSGHRVYTDFDGAIGQMTDRVAAGEPVDLVIVSGAQIDSLIRNGKVANGTRTDLAKVGIGAFVKRGADKPDISSVEAFKRTLLNARSVGYNDPAAGAPVSLYLIDLFQRLGVSAEMSTKTVVFKQRSERFDAVARGDVELGFNQISEIVAVPGVELVGPLPASIQRFTVFAAGIIASSKEPKAAMDFVRFISAPDTRAVWKSKGFEAP